MKKTFTKLSLTYYIFYIGAVLTALAGYYLTINGKYIIDAQSETGIVISSVFIIFIIGSIPASLGLFHFMLKKWQQIEDESIRIKKYENGSILRLVVIGLGIIFGVFFFYILRSQSMIFCAGIAAIALFFCKPTKEKINSELYPEKMED